MQTSTTLLKKPLYLWLARGIWILLALIAVVIFIASNSGLYTIWRQPCDTRKPEEQARCFDLEQAVNELGLKRSFFSIYWPLGQTVEVLSWLITGIFIFWKKSDGLFELLFSLMLVMVIPLAVDGDMRLDAVRFYPNLLPIAKVGSYIASLLLILWYRFPDGRLIPRWFGWFAVTWIVIQSGSYFFPATALNLYNLPSPWSDLINPLFAVSFIYSSVYRYRHIADPTQKQQIKWVVFSISILALLASINYLKDALINLGIMPWNTHTLIIWWLTYWPFFYLSSMFVGISLGYSLMRYRLWDVDTFISSAIVYGSLTGILGLVGFAVIPLINYALTQALGNQSGILAVLVSAFPIAALYNPVHERLQQWVEKRFKPEEMDFENTFIEFTSELRSLFTVKELSTLLARHAVEQLDIAHASVFLNGKNRQLKHLTSIHSDGETSKPSLDEKTMEKMRKGELASPDGDYAKSLIVPLVVPRSRKPSLLGILFLGPRLQGVGYSTAMLKSLKKFGADVGKTFYAAEIQSDKAHMLLEKG